MQATDKMPREMIAHCEQNGRIALIEEMHHASAHGGPAHDCHYSPCASLWAFCEYLDARGIVSTGYAVA